MVNRWSRRKDFEFRNDVLFVKPQLSSYILFLLIEVAKRRRLQAPPISNVEVKNIASAGRVCFTRRVIVKTQIKSLCFGIAKSRSRAKLSAFDTQSFNNYILWGCA